MRRLLLTPVLIAFLAVSATPLAAQDTPHSNRSGFWIDIGLGGGSLGFSVSDGVEIDSETGFSGNLSLGGTLSPKVQLGGGTMGWTKSDAGTGGALLAIVNWFPSATGDVYLRGGLGFFTYSETDLGFEFSVSSAAMMVGVGYDFMVSSNIGITPYFNFLYAAKSEIKIDGTGSGIDASSTLAQLGVALSIN